MKFLESSAKYHLNRIKGSSFYKKIFSKTLLHALTDKSETTDAMILGSAIHCAILEPERFEREFITLPDDAPRRPTSAQVNAKKPSEDSIKQIAWWKDFDAFADGKTILDKNDLATVMGMKEAVLSHPLASQMLSGGEAEYSYYSKDPVTGIETKCRPDYHAGGSLIDIKSTSDASFEGFAKQIGNLAYHLQAAFYLDVFNQSQGTNYTDFHFIAVENKAPYAVAIYRLDENHIEAGRKAYRKAMDRYAEFLASGASIEDLTTLRNFGYPTDIIDIQVPYYILDKVEIA